MRVRRGRLSAALLVLVIAGCSDEPAADPPPATVSSTASSSTVSPSTSAAPRATASSAPASSAPGSSSATSAGTTSAPAPTAPRGPADCRQPGDRTVAVARPGAAALQVTEVGRGATTAALLPAAGGSPCDWLPFARSLAASGARVVVAPAAPAGTRSTGAAGTAISLAAHARRTGATEFVLAGAGDAGTTALAVAAQVGAERVAALSPVPAAGGPDALVAVAVLRVPALVLATRGDTASAAYARRLGDAGRGLVTVLSPPGDRRGTALLGDRVQAIEAAVLLSQFLLARS